MTDLVVKLLITADGKQSVQEVKLTRDEMAKLNSESKEGAKANDELGASTTALGSSLKVMGLAAAAAVAALGVSTVREAAKAYAEAEQSNARLNAVLRATGNAAGLSADQINALADSLAATTQFDDEAIRNASAVMATFRNVQGDTFREGIGLATDLSALLGTDLQSAVLQIGKALNEPEQGITALSRAGIQFSDVQKEQIKNFVETNELGKAQAIVLAEMKNQFGGTAQAMNTGITAAANDLNKSWNELLESLGGTQAVAGGATSMLNLLAIAADLAAERMERAQRAAVGLRGQLTPLPPAPPAFPNLASLPGPPPRTTNGLIGDVSAEEARAMIAAAEAKNDAELKVLREGAAAKLAVLDDALQTESERIDAEYRKRADAAALAYSAGLVNLKQFKERETQAWADAEAKKIALAPPPAADETGPQANVIQLAEARQRLRNEAELQTFREGAAAKLAALDTAQRTETERIDAQYQKEADTAALAYSAGIIDLQGYKDRETQAWADAEAKKTGIAKRGADDRTAIDEGEFQARIRAAQNVASIFGALSSLAEGRNKRDFENSKRLARAETIVNTGAAIVKAYLRGSWLEVAAVTALGAAQLNRINETQYSGGGSIAAATGGGAGGAVPGTDGASSPNSATPQSGSPSRGITNFYITGESLAGATLTQTLEAFQEAINRNDQVFIHYDSRQARVLRNEAA